MPAMVHQGEMVAPRKGRVSRNVDNLIKFRVAVLVAPRKGRVSRNHWAI